MGYFGRLVATDRLHLQTFCRSSHLSDRNSNRPLRFILLHSPQSSVQIVSQSRVNFTNNLRAAFSYESVLSSFSVLTFRFVIFQRKEIGAKAARKMLVKLTPGRQLITSDIAKLFS